jgi:hypothetical protein
MNSKVLIDTSIWIDYFKGQDKNISEKVKDLVISLRAVLCGVVLSELLSGIRKARDRETLKGVIDAIDYIEVSKSTWVLAGETFSKLRQRGLTIPLTDLVVSSLARENDYELWSHDSHFDCIPELKRFRQ